MKIEVLVAVTISSYVSAEVAQARILDAIHEAIRILELTEEVEFLSVDIKPCR